MRRLIAMILCVIPALVHAGGGGFSGGALEVTQLANKAQLIAQVAESAKQTATQLAQLDTMIRNLNPLSALQMMQSGAAGEVGRLVAASVKTADDIQHVFNTVKNLHSNASTLSGTAWSAYAMMRPVLQEMERSRGSFGKDGAMDAASVHKIISETMAKMPEAERRAVLSVDGRIMSSEQYMQALNARLTGVSDSMNRLVTESGQINGITGNVQGLQFLAAQNVAIQASIKELTNTIIQIEMERAKRETEQMAAGAVRDAENKRRLQNKFNNMRIGI